MVVNLFIWSDSNSTCEVFVNATERIRTFLVYNSCWVDQLIIFNGLLFQCWCTNIKQMSCFSCYHLLFHFRWCINILWLHLSRRKSIWREVLSLHFKKLVSGLHSMLTSPYSFYSCWLFCWMLLLCLYGLKISGLLRDNFNIFANNRLFININN